MSTAEPSIDVLENRLQRVAPQLLAFLLIDQTKSYRSKQGTHNIFWATSDYEELGSKFEYHEPITPELITGKYGTVIRPRVLKAKDAQNSRSRNMAEVYTPAWICNEQNNLVDQAWFGRPDVFNQVPAGQTSWHTNHAPIEFPPGKTWQNYVHSTRLEITCGEAPYLVSRYDMTTGDFIPVPDRIGLLDRKLRVITENTHRPEDWLHWAKIAYTSVYGYEWQGDSLLLARENLLFTLGEHYEARWGERPPLEVIMEIATIISWNLWQMDALKGVIPNSCHEEVQYNNTLFGLETTTIQCDGCHEDELLNPHHNGIYCLVKDWTQREPRTGQLGKVLRFVDLF